jgi:hypothetical protein
MIMQIKKEHHAIQYKTKQYSTIQYSMEYDASKQYVI